MYHIWIEFTRPKGFKPISWIIRLFQRTLYSHVRLKWHLESGHQVVFEAAESSVRFKGQSQLLDEKIVIVKSYVLVLSKEQYNKVVNKAIELAGTKYGSLQLIGMAIAKFFHKRFNLFKDGKKTMVCSELVAYILRDCLNLQIVFREELDGPLELDKTLEMCQNNSNLFLS